MSKILEGTILYGRINDSAMSSKVVIKFICSDKVTKCKEFSTLVYDVTILN